MSMAFLRSGEYIYNLPRLATHKKSLKKLSGTSASKVKKIHATHGEMSPNHYIVYLIVKVICIIDYLLELDF